MAVGLAAGGPPTHPLCRVESCCPAQWESRNSDPAVVTATEQLLNALSDASTAMVKRGLAAS